MNIATPKNYRYCPYVYTLSINCYNTKWVEINEWIRSSRTDSDSFISENGISAFVYIFDEGLATMFKLKYGEYIVF